MATRNITNEEVEKSAMKVYMWEKKQIIDQILLKQALNIQKLLLGKHSHDKNKDLIINFETLVSDYLTKNRIEGSIISFG